MGLKKGKLFLIPTLLGDTTAAYILPQSTLEIIAQLDHFIVENLRTARRFLTKIETAKGGVTTPIPIFNTIIAPK